MKIFQINIVYKTGSTGKIAKDLNDLIIQGGWNSFIGYGRGQWNDRHCFKVGNKQDFYIHALGTRIFDKHGLCSKKATLNFINNIDNLDIDIFHLHNIHGYYLHYPTLFEYLKAKNKPVVWTLHDCWSFTGHCAYYEYVGCDKWKNECENCPQLRQYPASFVFDNSKSNFNLKKKYFTELENLTIVTPSQWLKGEVQKSFLSKYKTIVIHNGIDLETFKPRKSDFRKNNKLKDKFIILGVANVWEERKGFHYFIELSKILKKEEQIVLIGLSKKQLKSLPSNILGISRTENQTQLSEIYSTADVFVNPTLEDNFPTTNLESLACGTPVVTFRSGGSPEAVDERTGIVTPKGDLIALYDAIGVIQKNRKGFYGTYCRKKAEKLFRKDYCFNGYIDIYKQIRGHNV